MKIFSQSRLVAAVGLCAAIALGTGQSAPVFAQQTEGATQAEESAEDVALAFGIRPSILDISLSPSGNRIAWIAPGPNYTEVLKVFDLEGTGGIRDVTSFTEKTGDLSQCEWATDDRLVCEIYGMGQTGDGVLIPYTRMFAINHDGTDAQMVTDQQSSRARQFNQFGGSIVALDVADEPGQILITRNQVPESQFMSRIQRREVGLSVERLDLATMRSRTEVSADERASRYIADENGVVRVKIRALVDVRGDLTGERVVMVRDADGGSFEVLDSVTLDGQTISDFTPISVNAQRNVLFAYDVLGGYNGVIEIPLEAPHEARVLTARDDVDVAGLIRIGRQRRAVGVSYAMEKLEVEYFDEELARLAGGLARALPDTPLISIAGASADEDRLLLIASSDTQPGTVYLYEKSTRKLEPLLEMRDYLTGRQMGPMTPITFPAADGTQIPGYLTLPPGSDGKNLPAIVLPHGGPGARDVWGFDWIVQFFIARGYAVLQPNFRGSSGYGEDWFGRNGFQAWNVAIGDVTDAGRWLVSQGIANPDQLAIAGWSYGGYAALQSQVVDPDLFKAVVAIAPVTDLEFLRNEARDYTFFRLRDQQLGQGPHIAAGSPLRQVDKFKAPVALFHGTFDLNVNVRHSRQMADALEDAGKSVTYVEFDQLRHSLDDSKARSEMLAEIDRFLTEALGR